jgi:type IV pilus assembly protein PilC
MATAAAKAAGPKEFNFTWEGRDKGGKVIRGELRSVSESAVNATLRRQGIVVQKVRKQRTGSGGKITEKDITLFTRQLATMMKAGVPLLQSFDIVARAIPTLGAATAGRDQGRHREGQQPDPGLRKPPALLRRPVLQPGGRGRAGRYPGTLLDRLATYKEKILAIKGKIKSALFYPISIIVVAFIITAIIMIFVIPAFKEVFTSFGADLPGADALVMAISDFFVEWWWAIFGGDRRRHLWLLQAWKRSRRCRCSWTASC